MFVCVDTVAILVRGFKQVVSEDRLFQNCLHSNIYCISAIDRHYDGSVVESIAVDLDLADSAACPLRSEVNSELNLSPNFEGLVLGCIDADFCK